MNRLCLIFMLLLFYLGLGAQILVYGDTRNHPEVHRELVARVQDIPFSLVLFTGDMNRRGTAQSEYDEFKRIIAPLTGSYRPVRGNHERDLELFQQNFPQRSGQTYYSLVHDSLHFFILDSVQDLSPGSAQYQWLKSRLEESRLPQILLVHHPVFSSGPHGDELGLSLYLPALGKQYKVKAIISGHEHSFEHLTYDGIHYVVTGGGGAPLREMKKQSPHSIYFQKTHHYNILQREPGLLRFSTFDLKGEKIHEFSIEL
jgi:acid phosphatase type 7